MTCQVERGQGREIQFQNDLALEKNAVAEYNAGIAVCRKAVTMPQAICSR